MQKIEHFIEYFVPEHYELFFDLDRASKTFKGKVSIKGDAKQNEVKLHQKDLSVSSVKVNDDSREFELDVENDALIFTTDILGEQVITVEFSGNITDNMDGIYPCYYNVNGEAKELLATQFESHFARQAFPCIDEPAAKAIFDISLSFDQKDGEIALSNMPEKILGKGQETGLWEFETTPRMSTYILAFALGDLQNIRSKTKNGTDVAVYSTKAHDISSLEFALNIATRAIDFYEEYYGVKYPLAQSLHLALPDFSAGAMENWGLVTYREVALIANDNTPLNTKQQVALTICHELAHMWFGNLVTMNWWDNLWLNESFANMMEYLTLNELEPEWNIFESFQSYDAPAALERDATDGVQSVQVEVKHPDEINTIFDGAIVYAKGSRLLQMLRYGLGDEIFRKGLNIYFERHKYGNTVGQDLWNALGEASGTDVSSFMDSWLTQPGYPVITAKVEDNKLILSQEQFFIGPNKPVNRLYPVPLNSNWEDLKITMDEQELVIDNYAELKEKYDVPFRLNTDNMAHFITKYEGELDEAILENLSSYDNITKYQIIQEKLLLANSERISYAEFLPLIDRLKEEESFMVVSAIDRLTDALGLFIDPDTEIEATYKDFIKTVAQHNFDRLGFLPKKDEDYNDEFVRTYSVANIIYADDKEAIETAHAIFQKHVNNLESLPASVRAFIMLNEVKHYETSELADKLFKLYIDSNSGSFKRNIKTALAASKNEETLEKVIAALQNKDIIKPQDLSSWYASFLSKKFSQERIWTWARENWDWVKKALGGDMSFDSFVTIPAIIFKTEKRLAEYREFFTPELDNVGLKRNIEMGFNEIEGKINLRNKYQALVHETLKNL